MTVPAIFLATQSAVAGICALIVGIILALCGGKLFSVASACCIVVFILEMIIL
jgi:hypothetical protein